MLLFLESMLHDHDFHEGGLDAKQRKMFEGKLVKNPLNNFF